MVEGAPSDEIRDTLEASLAIFRRAEDGASSLALLRRRAEQDAELAVRVLRSYGYYGATARAEVIDLSPAAAGDDPDAAPKLAEARVALTPGAPYILESHVFAVAGETDGPPLDLPDPAALGSPVGAPAAAGGILEAERAAVAKLHAEGRPWAAAEGRRAIADPETDTLTVESRIAPGPYVTYGALVFKGLDKVEASHVRSYQTWERGDPVDVAVLRGFQRKLMDTDLFAAVSAGPQRKAPGIAGPEGAPAPITVRVEEAKRRSVSAGLRYATDAGPQVRGAFAHRNLFGAGERLEAGLEAGLQQQSLTLEGLKPQYRRPGQNLRAGLELRHQETEAFDETGGTLTLGLERVLDERWTVGAGGLIEFARIEDNGTSDDVLLFGLPAYAAYDATDNPLNRTEGVRGTLRVTPYQSTDFDGVAPFLYTDLSGAAYAPLDADRTYVLAARGRIGSILSGELSDVPLQRRLFSGGSESVRGYQNQFVGPLDASDDPTGGRSVVEAGLELRARIQGDFGAAVFAEAGSVSRSMFPEFDAGVQYAAGLGLRYYSPVGPIRIDVAAPLNPRSVDDPFAVYFSIGQAY